MIAEGDSSEVLRVAVGHMPGTALLGESGNVVLAAHRDAFFRRLGELKVGDVVRLTVPGAEHTYRVTFTDVVQPRETWVMEPATRRDNYFNYLLPIPLHRSSSRSVRSSGSPVGRDKLTLVRLGSADSMQGIRLVSGHTWRCGAGAKCSSSRFAPTAH